MIISSTYFVILTTAMILIMAQENMTRYSFDIPTESRSATREEMRSFERSKIRRIKRLRLVVKLRSKLREVLAHIL